MEKQSKITRVTIIIISTFVVMMVMSLITSIPLIMEFMGDFKCSIKEYHYGGRYSIEHWHYGWTHWLYIIMGVALSILQIVKIELIVNEDNSL